MRVLHLLDPAVLRHTEYRRRTLALIGELRAQGVQTVQLAGPCLAGAANGVADGVGDPAARATGDGAVQDDAAPDWHVYRTQAPARPGWWPQTGAAPLQLTLSAAALAMRLRQVARLTRPDLIHVHACEGHAPAWHALSSLVSAGQRLPLVAEAERRGGRRRGVPPLERWALARAAALSASSLEMRAALRGAGVRCHHIAVIPPASELAGVPRRDPTPPGLEGAPLLAYAGTLDRGGGIDLLLAALEAVRRRYPALRLVVAGGGVDEDALVRRIVTSGARGHVVVTGALSSRRSADLLPRADIAVFPALAGSAEPLAPPRHLLNAMAQGCTIVASDIACHRELLVQGHTGMLFRAGSRKALAEVLLGLLERPERRRALGVSAAAFAASRHTWAATAAGYRSLYRHVLAGRPR